APKDDSRAARFSSAPRKGGLAQRSTAGRGSQLWQTAGLLRDGDELHTLQRQPRLPERSREALGRRVGDRLGHGAQVPARRTDDHFRPEIRPQPGGPAPDKEAREPLAASRVEQLRAQALVFNDEGLLVARPAQAIRKIGCKT